MDSSVGLSETWQKDSEIEGRGNAFLRVYETRYYVFAKGAVVCALDSKAKKGSKMANLHI